jgi:hypothetical protein
MICHKTTHSIITRIVHEKVVGVTGEKKERSENDWRKFFTYGFFIHLMNKAP